MDLGGAKIVPVDLGGAKIVLAEEVTGLVQRNFHANFSLREDAVTVIIVNFLTNLEVKVSNRTTTTTILAVLEGIVDKYYFCII